MSIAPRSSTTASGGESTPTSPATTSACSSTRPPGSLCSIQFGTDLTPAAPGSFQSLYLVVPDIDAAREEITGRGVEVSEVFHEATLGDRFASVGSPGRVSGRAPEGATYGSFATFSDPDGNGWLLQEITTRLPGR